MISSATAAAASTASSFAGISTSFSGGVTLCSPTSRDVFLSRLKPNSDRVSSSILSIFVFTSAVCSSLTGAVSGNGMGSSISLSLFPARSSCSATFASAVILSKALSENSSRFCVSSAMSFSSDSLIFSFNRSWIVERISGPLKGLLRNAEAP